MASSRTLDQVRQLEREAQGAVPRMAKTQPAAHAPRAHKQTAGRRGEIVDTIIFWAFVAALAWVPYLWGSNVLEAWAINTVLFPGLAIAYEISLLVRGASHPVAVKTIRVSAALFVAVVIWILIQNATWTPNSLHHPIWGMAADELQTPVAGSISVNRDLTMLALLRLLTAASVLWLAMQLGRDGSRAIQFLMAFVAVSAAYAVYGLIAFAQSQSVNVASPSFVTSTFYNHDHYATYAGMGFIAVLGLIARVYEREMMMGGGSLGFRIGTFIEVTGRKAVLLLGSAFLLLVAVLLTSSRGGIIATGVGVLVWGALALGRKQRRSIEWRLALIVLVAVIAGGFLTFSGSLVGRLAQQGLADSNRLGTYALTLRSIFDRPLLGYGYGTFADIFPMFRDRSIDLSGVWEQAHNTYLELFQGLGVLFGAMLFASVLLLIVKCFRGAIARHQITVPCIAAGAVSLVTVHALVDFSLQIQAVTLTFMAILGAGVAQSQSSQVTLSD